LSFTKILCIFYFDFQRVKNNLIKVKQMDLDKNFIPEDSYDFIVIGGGPAGSVFSTLVAKEGYNVLVLEASKFPRFAVGEIIAPTAIWRIWNRMGITKEMLDPLFAKKWGANWITPKGEYLSFDQDVFPDDEVCHAHVYQLDRAVYDEFLLNHARANDVVALEEAKVENLLYDEDGRMNGVVFNRHGRSFEVRSKLVIDASGRANFIPKKLDLRMEIEELHSFSCFAHWEGCERDKGKRAGDISLLFTEDNLWYWWAPLKSPKASIGIVADRNVHWEEYSKDPEAFYMKWVANNPILQERIKNAKRITDFKYAEKAKKNGAKDPSLLTDFHTKSSQSVGNGWVLVGDTLGFVDPVFSLGLHIIHSGGAFLADAAIKGMKENNLSQEFLEKEYYQKYEDEFTDVLAIIQQWAENYYNPRFTNTFLRWGNKYSRIKDIYTRTIIGFEKDAIEQFVNLFPGIGSYETQKAEAS